MGVSDRRAVGYASRRGGRLARLGRADGRRGNPLDRLGRRRGRRGRRVGVPARQDAGHHAPRAGWTALPAPAAGAAAEVPPVLRVGDPAKPHQHTGGVPFTASRAGEPGGRADVGAGDGPVVLAVGRTGHRAGVAVDGHPGVADRASGRGVGAAVCQRDAAASGAAAPDGGGGVFRPGTVGVRHVSPGGPADDRHGAGGVIRVDGLGGRGGPVGLADGDPGTGGGGVAVASEPQVLDQRPDRRRRGRGVARRVGRRGCPGGGVAGRAGGAADRVGE